MSYMKQFTKWILMLSFFMIVFVSLPYLTQAQEEPPCVGPDPLDGDCPIDGGLSALLIIGVGYGIKKVRDARKSQNDNIIS